MRNYLLLIIGTMTLLITLPKAGARVISLSGFAQCQVKKGAASGYAQTHKCSKGCWRHTPPGQQQPVAGDASGCSEQVDALGSGQDHSSPLAGAAAQRQALPAVEKHPAPEVKKKSPTRPDILKETHCTSAGAAYRFCLHNRPPVFSL